MSADDKKIVVGRFGASYGVKGWLRIFSFTQPITNILEYGPLVAGDEDLWEPIKVMDYEVHAKGIVVKLKGCDDPETARLYTNKQIAINQQQLPKLKKNQYYWTQLIGLRVINQENVDFGVVEKLLETGANDVLVVKGERERLVPYISNVILAVDLKQKLIRVDWEADF